jgi:hypothetical protein
VLSLVFPQISLDRFDGDTFVPFLVAFFALSLVLPGICLVLVGNAAG